MMAETTGVTEFKVFLCSDGLWHVNPDDDPNVRDCRGTGHVSIAVAVMRTCEVAALAGVAAPTRFRGPVDAAAGWVAAEWLAEYEGE